MIKYFCDRCGAEMTKEKRHGFVSVNTRDKAEGDLLEENEFESWLFCQEVYGGYPEICAYIAIKTV